MDNRPKLKILFDRSSEAGEHARFLVSKIEKLERESTHMPKPRGVPSYAAVYPEVCEDCGETYWSRKDYSAHLGCTGAPKKGGNAGF